MDLRLKLVLACGAAFLILCTVGVLSYRSAVRSQQDQQWVSHTHEVLENLDGLELDLTPPMRFGSVQNDMATLIRLTADNPRQQASLRQFSELMANRPSATPAQFDTEAAALIVEMRREENRLLALRVKAAGTSLRQIKTVIVAGNLLTIFLVVVAGQVVRHEMARRTAAETAVRVHEQRFRLMAASVKEYAIINLDPEGHVIGWNDGAERMKGYRAEEIVGRHFSLFYTSEDIAAGKPALALQTAANEGQYREERWLVRRDGSRFLASIVITPVRDKNAPLLGFCKITRDLTEQKAAEEALQLKNAQLEAANKELDAFSYSVAHDLRAPLRAIDGFSQALLEDLKDQLPEEDRAYLQRVRGGATRMAELIDDLLKLARISRYQVQKNQVDLSGLAAEVFAQIKTSEQNGRRVEFAVDPHVMAVGDKDLLRIVFENLIGNAWKFTSKLPEARIEFGMKNGGGERVFFVRDNGPGFDMQYANKLFGVFQRLHRDSEFPGTGVGLATVQRIIQRHGGRIWAQATVGQGATFYFVL